MATLNIKGLPDSLYQLLAEQAKIDHRSLSGEAIYLLEQALNFKANKSSILEMQGLGKEYWSCKNATQYINEERDSWD